MYMHRCIGGSATTLARWAFRCAAFRIRALALVPCLLPAPAHCTLTMVSSRSRAHQLHTRRAGAGSWGP
jgi:hypothetical protein